MLTFCKGYVVKVNPNQVLPHLNVTSAKKVDYETWHKHLGHPSKEILVQLDKNVNRYKKVELPKEKRCIGCLKGKMKAKPYKESLKRATKPFQLIHMDLMECPIQSYHKYIYICVIVDDFSSYTWIGLLTLKSNTLQFFTTWYNKVNDPSNRILYLRSDHGGEFINQAFNKFLSEKGITHQNHRHMCINKMDE